ncbi:MAG TPA: radical SAM protein, partial [Desulfobacteraceae bacterium]|nr:radical SAM protein [Desulfobacteraceae bacterium]
FSKFPIPRLGTVLLSTILRERGYKVKTFIEDLAVPDWSFIESSDIVCISTTTSTAIKAYKMGQRLRALHIPVIMGGAHPTFLPDEALEYADFVIRGEGEHSLVELLEHMDRGVPALRDIKGLSYRDRAGEIVHNPPREFIEDLDILPKPDFSLVHNWTPSNTYPVSTSRGCPHDCTFCSVIGMFGRRYRFKSVEAALEELKYAASVSHATKFIVDDNFAAGKKRAKEILRGMIADKIRTRWSAQVRTDVARDPELLRLMADSGCHTLFIGFESVNPRTLEEYNKKQALEDIVSCVREVRYHGIHIHGMFVLGAETDDVDTIHKTVDFAKGLGMETVQIMILTPLPGTPLFDHMRKSGRLLHTDWSKYDVQHAVFKPRLMSPATLQIETLRAMARFYSWKYVFRHLARLNFHYTAVGIFAKRAVYKSLKAFSAHLDDSAATPVGCEKRP